MSHPNSLKLINLREKKIKLDHQFAYSNMATSAERNDSSSGKKPIKPFKDYEACAFTLCEVYGEIFDQNKGEYIQLAGVLSVVEKSYGVFIEWKPCEPSGVDMAIEAAPKQPQLVDQDDWVIEEAEEATNQQNRSSMPRESPPQSSQIQQQQKEKKTTQNQKYSFSVDLGSLRSFIHGNLKKGSGPVWIRFICKDGTESDNYHLRGGGYESLINCLQRYLFLNRSARADNLVIISDSRTEALEKSVGMLNLDKKDIVTRFLANPYATSMTLASKVTSALAPLLDPETVISESQLRAVRQEQKFAGGGDDEGAKLRSHNEAGFEHIFQLDLPARPQILNRDEPVDEAKWAEFRSPDGRIADPHGLKSLIFRGGIVPAMRPTIWKYMLGYYKWECTDAENEKQRKRLKEDYYRMKLQWTTITEDQESRNGGYRDRKALVEKDVARTDRSHPFFSRTKPENLKLLRDVLMTYCMYDFDLGYVQGMSDFIAVLCIILKAEEDIFWCFVGLMKIVHKNFEMDQIHIKTQLSNLKSLIEIVNPRLANYLEAHDSDHMYFCFRWILVWFKRELSIEDSQYLWEILWTGIPCRAFLLLFCVAILDAQADVIIENKFGLTEILKHINNMSMRIDVQRMLCVSEAIYHQLAAVQDKLPRHICEILSFNFGDESNQNGNGGENGNKIDE